MVAEHSTLRVTAEPFIPQKVVGGEEAGATPIKRAGVTPFRGVIGGFTPLKSKEVGGEFATPSKQYRLRELSPEEIASKAIRPSPIRPKKAFSPVALFESPLKSVSTPLRGSRNTCSKLHCKRCAYREQQQAKDVPRNELDFQKEHDVNCSFAGVETPETPLKTQDQQLTLSPIASVKPHIVAPIPELPKPPQRRKVSTPVVPETTSPTTTSNNTKTSPRPSDRVTHTTSTIPTSSSSSETSKSVSPMSSTTSVNKEAHAPSSQQHLRAGLLILVAMLLVLLLVQRNGLWKSGLRALVATVVAFGTAVYLGPAVASRSPVVPR